MYRSLILVTAILMLAARPALAGEIRIGLAAPMTGSTALLGNQMQAGAEAAIETVADAKLVVSDTDCSAEGGLTAANAFVEAQIQFAAGFLCTEAITAALPILTNAGIPIITPGVRTNSLTDNRAKTGHLIWRLAPRADMEAQAIAAILTERWRTILFAIIDDGTIYGRDLAESFRLSAELAALQPVFTDTYRPQLDNQIGLAGRLRSSGASHVFAGGDRDDIAILGRDAAGLGINLVLVGGEALNAAPGEVDLARGTMMVGLPDHATNAPPSLIETLRAAEIEPDGYVLPTYAAVQIALAALGDNPDDGGEWDERITAQNFDTAIGPVRFDDKGDLTINPYRLFAYDGDTFRPLE